MTGVGSKPGETRFRLHFTDRIFHVFWKRSLANTNYRAGKYDRNWLTRKSKSYIKGGKIMNHNKTRQQQQYILNKSCFIIRSKLTNTDSGRLYKYLKLYLLLTFCNIVFICIYYFMRCVHSLTL